MGVRCKSFTYDRWYNIMLDNISHKLYNCLYTDLSISNRNHVIQIMSNRIQVYYNLEPPVVIEDNYMQRVICIKALNNILEDTANLMFHKSYDHLNDEERMIVDDHMEELLDAIFDDIE